jgi:hypothetical protein
MSNSPDLQDINSPDIEQNNEQLLNDIQSLQNLEKDLMNNLESNPNLSSSEQKKILDKINQISNMRINLYQTIGGISSYFQNTLSLSNTTLKDQVLAIHIVEDELNKSKKKLEYLEKEKNNKIRLVEINDYYGEKYSEHTSLMKIILFTILPIIILTIFKKKELLPEKIYYILLIIIAVIGAYYFWIKMGSIVTRDVMNYNQYDWYFDASKAPALSSVADSSSSVDPWQSTTTKLTGTCIGDACCSAGQTYDTNLNKCMITG